MGPHVGHIFIIHYSSDVVDNFLGERNSSAPMHRINERFQGTIELTNFSRAQFSCLGGESETCLSSPFASVGGERILQKDCTGYK